MHTPTFSVVIPTYERARPLARAVESVLAQTYGDFELIVVDDASSDATPKVIAAFNDPRVAYIRRKRNGGNAAARNAGIRRAKGRFVAFLDDDDAYLPRFLEKTHAAYAGAPGSVGLTWCGVRWVANGRAAREDLWAPAFKSRKEAYVDFLRTRKVGLGHGVTVRRRCFDEVGLFDEGLRAAVDTEFLIRLVRAYDFRVVPEVLVELRRHSGSRMHRRAKLLAETYEQIIEKHAGALQQHGSVHRQLHYKAGWLNYHAGQRRQGRAHLLRVLRRAPLSGKAWLMLFSFEILGQRTEALHLWFSKWSSKARAG